MDPNILICKKKEVIDFYKNNPNLDFETMNCIFVTIMENLKQDMNSSLNSNIASQLLNHIQVLQSQINVVSENVIKLQSDTIMNFTVKFSEFKKEYIDDVKFVLTNNTADKIAPLIKDYNSILLDKTHLMLNDIVPKNNDRLTTQLQDIMKTFHSSLTDETNKLLKSTINQQTLTSRPEM